MNTKIPSYLCKKANVNRLILVTSIFALLFINIFEPFGSLVIYRTISEFKYFLLSSVIILDGMIIVVLSRLAMLDFAKKHSVTYLHYVIWVLSEIIALALFFSLFNKFIVEEEMDRNFIDIFNNSAVNAGIVLLLPYSILWLYFRRQEKKISLQGNSPLDKNIEELSKQEIAFPDESGNLRISVPLKDILYIDSTDNFVTIHYLNQSRLSHFLIRNSLTRMIDNLTNDDSLVRCHRNYIVNLEKVRVLHKNKGEVTLELDNLNSTDIPVSSLYYDKFISKFAEFS